MIKVKKLIYVVFIAAVICVIALSAVFAAVYFVIDGCDHSSRQAGYAGEITSSEGGMTDGVQWSEVSSEDKTLTTKVAFDREDNGAASIDIEQKIVWNEVPEERYSDIFALYYSSDMYMPLVRSDYYNAEVVLEYDEASAGSTKHSAITFNCEDKSNYYAEEGFFAYRFSLPEGDVDNIVATLKVTVTAMTASLIGAPLVTCYVHQYGDGEFSWEKISGFGHEIFYKTDFWTDDPAFELPLHKYMNLTFSEFEKNS